jgi:hypothetical protein
VPSQHVEDVDLIAALGCDGQTFDAEIGQGRADPSNALAVPVADVHAAVRSDRHAGRQVQRGLRGEAPVAVEQLTRIVPAADREDDTVGADAPDAAIVTVRDVEAAVRAVRHGIRNVEPG